MGLHLELAEIKKKLDQLSQAEESDHESICDLAVCDFRHLMDNLQLQSRILQDIYL